MWQSIAILWLLITTLVGLATAVVFVTTSEVNRPFANEQVGIAIGVWLVVGALIWATKPFFSRDSDE